MRITHNPFNLAGSINVAPGDDNVVYEAAEIDMCGAYALIVPLRNALTEDRTRHLSTFDEVWQAYKDGVTVDTWDYEAKPVPGGRRGHYFVYTPELVKQMVEAVDGDWWELVAEEAVDTKVFKHSD